jgi:hypothetical protein
MSQPLILRGERPGFADAHRDDGKRFVVGADEKLTFTLPTANDIALKSYSTEKAGTTKYLFRTVSVN